MQRRYRSVTSIYWQPALELFPGAIRSDNDEAFVPWPLGTFAENEVCYSHSPRLVSQDLNSRSDWPACALTHVGASEAAREKSSRWQMVSLIAQYTATESQVQPLATQHREARRVPLFLILSAEDGGDSADRGHLFRIEGGNLPSDACRDPLLSQE